MLSRILILSLALILPTSLPAGHALLIQGKGKIAELDSDGKVKWEMSWGGIHDVHVLPSGNIMAQQGGSKIAEIDVKNKKVIWSYDSATQNGNQGKKVEVHAFQPLNDGKIMIAESGVGRIIEIDREGKIHREIKLQVTKNDAHRDTRLVRKIASGNYLVCHEGDGVVKEYDPSGKVVWEFEVPLFDRKPAGGHGPEAWGNQTFCALRLPNSNTLISTGNGHGVLEVTPEKKIVWQLQQKELKDITLAWVTTLEVLPNGNFVIGNCHAGKGQPQVIEIEPKSKKVVWTFDQFEHWGNDVSNTLLLQIDGKRIR